MFTWVGNQVDTLLNGYVLSVVASLTTALAPVALSALTLWIGLYGWAVLRHEANESIQSFAWNTFKIGLVFAVALQAGVYSAYVAALANDLSTAVASIFLPATTNSAAITSPYELLDAFNDQSNLLVLDLLKDAGILRLDLLLSAIVCGLGNGVFLCVALAVITLAKVLLCFVLAVGPLFILCLAFRPTARFFDSWLSMVLNAVVLAWFAFFALGLSIYLGQRILQVVQGNGGFLGSNFNVVAESLKYCVVMVLMAIICFQAPGLAAALTGGAPVQQGLQMVQNALMIAGLRSISSARSAPASASQGGVVRAGAGMLGRASQAASGAARTPAYQLAAQRGRS